MAVGEFKNELLVPVSDFWRNDVAEWLDAVDVRFLASLEGDDWRPGPDLCLAAFTGDVCPRVVWLGKSPYAKAERATGLSSHDGTTDTLFHGCALDARINKATSLRNMLKAWLRADGRLREGETNAEHVQAMCKEGLVEHVGALFEHGIEEGWLWLNAGLSIGGRLEESAHWCGWWPFVTRAVASASASHAVVVLLGAWAKTYRSDVLEEELVVEAVHPRNESFVEHAGIRDFLGGWTHLIHHW